MCHVPWVFSDNWEMRRIEGRFSEEERVFGLIEIDYPVLGVKLEEDLKNTKTNADKSKGMALGCEKVAVPEVCVNGRQMENFSDFELLRLVLEASCAEGTECCRKVTSERKVVYVISSLVNARSQ